MKQILGETHCGLAPVADTVGEDWPARSPPAYGRRLDGCEERAESDDGPYFAFGAPRLAGLLLSALAAGATPAPRDYEFRHENVLGTSLELIVRADTEEAARLAEARVLGEIDRLAAILSGYDAASEFRRWQVIADRPVEGLPRAVRAAPRQRPLARAERRGLRSPRPGPVRTLVALRPARPAADGR